MRIESVLAEEALPSWGDQAFLNEGLKFAYGEGYKHVSAVWALLTLRPLRSKPSLSLVLYASPGPFFRAFQPGVATCTSLPRAPMRIPRRYVNPASIYGLTAFSIGGRVLSILTLYGTTLRLPQSIRRCCSLSADQYPAGRI